MVKYIFHVDIRYWFNKMINISLYTRENINTKNKDLQLCFITNFKDEELIGYEDYWFIDECYYFTLWKWRNKSK